MVTQAAGALTKRVLFQSPVVDAAGQQTGGWKDEGYVYARIEGLTGRELFIALQSSPDLTHKITTRYKPGVESDWRIKYGTRVFHLDRPPIDVEEAHVRLEMICIEKPETTV